MKRFKLLMATFAVAFLGAFAVMPAATVGAIDPLADACNNNASAEICQNKDEDGSDLIAVIVNTLLFLVGTLAVIMIIVGGILYTISNGDAGKLTKAKNTLTYAIVGLVVAFVAYALVNWVLKLF